MTKKKQVEEGGKKYGTRERTLI